MNRRVLAALLALTMTAPSAAFAGFEKEALPQTVIPLAPMAAPALPAASLRGQAVSLSAIENTVAPQLQAIAQPSASAESSAGAGESATRILQGGKAQDGGSAVDAGAAPSPAPASLAPAQPSAPAANAIPDGRGDGSLPLAAVNGGFSYRARRAVLAFVSSVFGMGYSLPPAGPRLTQAILKEASSKQFVISDFDDTLAPHNSILSPETAAAIVALRKAGKQIAVVTVRPSLNPRPTDVTILTSLSTIAPKDRAGIIAGSLQDGYILQYDANGDAKTIYQEPPFTPQENQAIREAAAAVASALPVLGAAKGDLEFLDPLKYIMSLKGGTPESTVVAVAAKLQEELAKRGVDYGVEPRMAKDPTKPPYVTFGKIDKSRFIGKLAQLEGIKPEDALILGDSMYAPKTNKSLGFVGRWADRVARRMSGVPMPLTGNADDRHMERALPGALTLSVGATADATMKNGYALASKGPGMTRKIIEAVASRPSKAIAAEHKFLKGQRRGYDRAIAQAEPAADRVKSEYWALVMDKRDDVFDRIVALEKKFPALTGRESFIPAADPLAAKAVQTDLSSPARAVFAAQDFLGSQYTGLRLAKALARVENGAATGWTVEFYGRPKDVRFPRLHKFVKLTATVTADSISAVRGEERRLLGEDAAPYEDLWRAKFGNAAYTNLSKVMGSMKAFYPDFEVDGIDLVRQVKTWTTPAMMPMDPDVVESEVVWDYVVTGKSWANPNVTISQELDVTRDGVVINPEARTIKGAPEQAKVSPDAQVFASLTVYGDFGDFRAATSQRPLRAIIDQRLQRIADAYDIHWISPELDTISVPNTSFDGSGRYFHHRARMAKKDYERMKAESRFKSFITMDYAEKE